jgi:hypothetical protein
MSTPATMNPFHLPNLWAATPEVLLDWHDRVIDLWAAQAADLIVHKAKAWVGHDSSCDRVTIEAFTDYDGTGVVDVKFYLKNRHVLDIGIDEDEASSILMDVLPNEPTVLARMAHWQPLDRILSSTPVDAVQRLAHTWPVVPEGEIWMSLSPPSLKDLHTPADGTRFDDRAPASSSWEDRLNEVRATLLLLAFDRLVAALPPGQQLDCRLASSGLALDWVIAPDAEEEWLPEEPAGKAGECRILAPDGYRHLHAQSLTRLGRAATAPSTHNDVGESLVGWFTAAVHDDQGEPRPWMSCDAGQFAGDVPSKHLDSLRRHHEKILLQQSMPNTGSQGPRGPRL